MPLHGFYPKPGHILLCDFGRGFVAPEMVKTRQVVVISPATTHIRRLCTVVPLSTTAPSPEEDWHYLIKKNHRAEDIQQVWVKGDMLYTVSFDRLDKLHRKTRKGREYFVPMLDTTDLDGAMHAVRAYLSHLPP